jgi:hypothetical protein
VGAVKSIVPCALPAVATGLDGASGTVIGVIDTEDDDEELPAALLATTVKVYKVPLVNPVTVNGEPDTETVLFTELYVYVTV